MKYLFKPNLFVWFIHPIDGVLYEVFSRLLACWNSRRATLFLYIKWNSPLTTGTLDGNDLYKKNGKRKERERRQEMDSLHFNGPSSYYTKSISPGRTHYTSTFFFSIKEKYSLIINGNSTTYVRPLSTACSQNFLAWC